MTKPCTYLDYNATAPLLDSAADAMREAMMHVGNPSSVHAQGRLARSALEKAREAVSSLINVPADWVIFTSGGTESDNLALNGVDVDRVLISAIEHAAVLQAHEHAQLIPVDSDGIVDLTALEAMLKDDPRSTLISVMAANNETGAIQPLKQICEIAHAHGALVHSDAVQMVGKCDFDMREIGLDMLSLSAHKIGGPQGVGALVKSKSIPIQAQVKGGGQERSFRGGTENLIGIVGFGQAASEKHDFSRVQHLRDHMEEQIKASSDDVLFFSDRVERLPNTSCFAIKGMPSERQVMAMDLAGVMISAGSACSSGKVKSSHVLKAMNVHPDWADCAIRVSLGWDTQPEDIEEFMSAWSKIVERVKVKKKDQSNAA